MKFELDSYRESSSVSIFIGKSNENFSLNYNRE